MSSRHSIQPPVHLSQDFIIASARLSALALELSLKKVALVLRSYNPNQPRVPAGQPDGGQWTGNGNSSGRVRYAQAFEPPRARMSDATPPQAARLLAAEIQANSLFRRVQELEPNWRPEPSMASRDVEGEIARVQGMARAAQARLQSYQTWSYRDLAERFRVCVAEPDMFGNPGWPRGQGTVAVTRIDGLPVFGVNSRSPAYTEQDRLDAERNLDAMIRDYPGVMKTRDIGKYPNNALYHAEANVLLRATRYGYSLSGRELDIFVDRKMCPSCERVLPTLGVRMGNPSLTFRQPNGSSVYISNGTVVK